MFSRFGTLVLLHGYTCRIYLSLIFRSFLFLQSHGTFTGRAWGRKVVMWETGISRCSNHIPAGFPFHSSPSYCILSVSYDRLGLPSTTASIARCYFPGDSKSMKSLGYRQARSVRGKRVSCDVSTIPGLVSHFIPLWHIVLSQSPKISQSVCAYS